MSSTVLVAKCDARRTRSATRVLFSSWIVATVTAAIIVRADPPQGSVVGWGSQVVGVDLSGGFVAVAAGDSHSLGLKADGSIVAWGWNYYGQTNVPVPNADFIGIAAGGAHSLGLKSDGSIVAWGNSFQGQTNVPFPNTGFVALAAGGYQSLAIRRVMGDADADGDVDLADFAVFVDDLEGPFVEPQPAGWQFFDVDTDDDVDLGDLARWQNAFTGP